MKRAHAHLEKKTLCMDVIFSWAVFLTFLGRQKEMELRRSWAWVAWHEEKGKESWK